MQNEKQLLRNIGKCLRELRIERGYTSYETFAYDYELPRVHYWRMEKGATNFTIRSLLRVLEAHQLSLWEFFTLVSKS